MTRAELRQAVRDMLGEQYSGNFSTAALNRYINRAYRQLVMDIQHSFAEYFITTSTITTTANSAYITLPTNCVMVKKIYDSDGDELLVYRQTDFDSTDTGTPEYFTIEGIKLKLYPIPTSAISYTLVYHYLPTSLAYDTDAVDFPIGYEELIADYATILASYQDDANMRDFKMNFERNKKNMLQGIKTRQTRDTRHVSYGLGNPADKGV